MTGHAQTATEAQLRPYYGRIVVAESPVAEGQRDSGLILPYSDERRWMRGIVTATADDLDPALPVGTVVYFLLDGAIRILQSWVVDAEYVIATEAD